MEPKAKAQVLGRGGWNFLDRTLATFSEKSGSIANQSYLPIRFVRTTILLCGTPRALATSFCRKNKTTTIQTRRLTAFTWDDNTVVTKIKANSELTN